MKILREIEDNPSCLGSGSKLRAKKMRARIRIHVEGELLYLLELGSQRIPGSVEPKESSAFGLQRTP
jgi:hypothetical protein